MVDVVDKATRSQMMSGIAGKNTHPELTVRKYLHSLGFRYRLYVKNLLGRPDIVLPKYGAVVFVNGCFWHRHARCKYSYMPKSNIKFWKEKFTANVERDQRARKQLKKAGWRVHVIWECQVNERALLRLTHILRNNSRLDILNK